VRGAALFSQMMNTGDLTEIEKECRMLFQLKQYVHS
jgi:hypothetical protein